MADKVNPYTGLLDVMGASARDGAQREAAAAGAGCFVGTVLGTAPLKIQLDGLTLEKDELLVNSALLPGYGRGMSFAGQSGTAMLTGAGFAAGDRVLLFPGPDMSQFYVMCVLKAVG